jgi:hypothetical protein
MIVEPKGHLEAQIEGHVEIPLIQEEHIRSQMTNIVT